MTCAMAIPFDSLARRPFKLTCPARRPFQLATPTRRTFQLASLARRPFQLATPTDDPFSWPPHTTNLSVGDPGTTTLSVGQLESLHNQTRVDVFVLVDRRLNLTCCVWEGGHGGVLCGGEFAGCGVFAAFCQISSESGIDAGWFI